LLFNQQNDFKPKSWAQFCFKSFWFRPRSQILFKTNLAFKNVLQLINKTKPLWIDFVCNVSKNFSET
jgi:hypothetical protein